jgi:hypothetical protein
VDVRDAPAGAVMGELWRLMDSQAWDSLNGVLDPDLQVEFVHTGETFGREAYVALNRDYPGAWRTEIVELVADASRAAARVRVTDGSETHYVASFGTIEGGLITKLVEVWVESGVDVPTDRRPDRV